MAAVRPVRGPSEGVREHGGGVEEVSGEGGEEEGDAEAVRGAAVEVFEELREAGDEVEGCGGPGEEGPEGCAGPGGGG